MYMYGISSASHIQQAHKKQSRACLEEGKDFNYAKKIVKVSIL